MKCVIANKLHNLWIGIAQFKFKNNISGSYDRKRRRNQTYKAVCKPVSNRLGHSKTGDVVLDHPLGLEYRTPALKCKEVRK